MLRAAHQIEAPVPFQLLTRKTYAQSEQTISILPAPRRAIRGDRANAVRLKNAFAGSSEVAHRLLAEMGAAGELSGRDEKPETGGHVTRIFVRAKK